MKTLGIDIGTTTISAVVFQKETGVLASKTVKNDSFLEGESWERLQDPQRIYTLVLASIQELLEQHPDVCAIGVTGQMHGMVYLDAEGNDVSPLYIWQDGRGDLPCRDGQSWADALSELTGYPLATGYGMVTHWYNLKNGIVPDQAVCLCTIPDYIAMKLAGLSSPKIEPTNAASLGLYNGPKACFDVQALEKAEIDPAILPTLISQPCLGTGPIGLPVYAALGDNQASFLGATGGRTDVLLVNMGTGGQISVYSPTYVETATLETRPFPDGGWLLVGASLCGGRSYALLENFFRQTVKMVTGQEQSAYGAMEKLLSSSAPVTDFPKASTLFQGTRKEPSKRASLSGIGVDNFTPLHLMYSIMNGMADELYEMYTGYLSLSPQPPALMIGSGNGLRFNPHLCNIFQQRFQYPLIISENDEEAACGCAIYAANHF